MINIEKNMDINCEGLFFKAYVSTWIDPVTDSVNEKRQLRLMKRKSCKGCEVCYGFWEYFLEMGFQEEIDLSNIKIGNIYTPIFIPDSYDEYGTCDDYHFEFRKTKE